MPKKEELGLDLDIIYWAGLFDADGSVGVYRYKTHRGPQFRLYAGIGLCERPSLEGLSDRFGSSVKERPLKTGRIFKYWQVDHKQAAAFLTAIQPYVRGKKAQVDLALEFNSRITPNKGRSLAPEEIEIRAGIAKRIRDLKTQE